MPLLDRPLTQKQIDALAMLIEKTPISVTPLAELLGYPGPKKKMRQTCGQTLYRLVREGFAERYCGSRNDWVYSATEKGKNYFRTLTSMSVRAGVAQSV